MAAAARRAVPDIPPPPPTATGSGTTSPREMKWLRAALDLKQEHMAALLGVHRVSYAHYERVPRRMSDELEVLIRFLRLGITAYGRQFVMDVRDAIDITDKAKTRYLILKMHFEGPSEKEGAGRGRSR